MLPIQNSPNKNIKTTTTLFQTGNKVYHLNGHQVSKEVYDSVFGSEPEVLKPEPSVVTVVEAPKEYRHPSGKRFDLLDPDFLEAMAKIMWEGERKYGPDNWKKGLSGENSGVNHGLAHMIEYMAGTKCDYGPREMHLAQVAVNAMFEYFHAKKARLEREGAEALEKLKQVSTTRYPRDENS